MRQTVEEAAKEYIYKARASFVGITPEEYEEQINPEYPYNVGTDEDFESLFIAGADWQAKQSPWISVEERLPEQNELVLCRMVSNGAIVSGYIFVEDKKTPRVATQSSFEFEDWNDYECDMWMPIPSFDDILEANKDVLERIKEKGN